MHSPPAWLGEGLCKGTRVYTHICFAREAQVFQRDGMEKGVRATSSFKSGAFVREFEADLLTREQFEAAEKEY